MVDQHVQGQPCWTPTMSDMTPIMSSTAIINEYVSIYLSCVCFYCIYCIYCFIYSYSLTRVCSLFVSTVFYHHQQCQHVPYQHICHHEVLPFKQQQLQPERIPNMNVWTIERGDGIGVSNGLDRGHVDVLVDDVDIPIPNTSKKNKLTRSNYKQNTIQQTPGQ